MDVLKKMTSMFTGYVGLLNFEMINPSDQFGKMMLENLEDRGCKLLGIMDIPDIPA